MSVVTKFEAQAPRILGIFRIIAAILFAAHGAQKLFGAFGGIPPGVPPYLVYIPGTIEFFGGILLAIGFLARPVAFLASGEMAVAYFWKHAPNGFWPNVNGGELALFFCWIWLYIAAQGPGTFALDNLLWRKRATAA